MTSSGSSKTAGWAAPLLALGLVSFLPFTTASGIPQQSLPELVRQTFRAAASSAIGVPIALQSHTLRYNDEWAFLVAQPLTSDGVRIDYQTTKIARERGDEEFDDVIFGLARISDGRWAVLELIIGATDAPFVDWTNKHGVPASVLFGDPAQGHDR